MLCNHFYLKTKAVKIKHWSYVLLQDIEHYNKHGIVQEIIYYKYGLVLFLLWLVIVFVSVVFIN